MLAPFTHAPKARTGVSRKTETKRTGRSLGRRTNHLRCGNGSQPLFQNSKAEFLSLQWLALRVLLLGTLTHAEKKVLSVVTVTTPKLGLFPWASLMVHFLGSIFFMGEPHENEHTTKNQTNEKNISVLSDLNHLDACLDRVSKQSSRARKILRYSHVTFLACFYLFSKNDKSTCRSYNWTYMSPKTT